MGLSLKKRHIKIMLTMMLMLSFIYNPFTTEGSEQYNFVNQSGSTMSLSIDKSGIIKGQYITALGCGIGKTRPLTGWRNGKAIIFSVNFEECESITSWVGHSDDLSEIETIWTLVKGNNDWNMKLTGISHFKRTKTE